MTITLREVASASFRTDEMSDDLNTKFMEWLGSRTRYLPARLAIGRSLSIDAVPSNVDQNGRAIKGETLFGDALGAWLSLIVEHAARESVTLRDVQSLVSSHWARGLEILEKDWNACGEDRERFLRHIADQAGLSSGPAMFPTDGDLEEFPELGPIKIPVGELGLNEDGDLVNWTPNAAAGSPHLAVMGGSGKGKTRTICSMLRGMRQLSPVPILAFDFKDDLTNQYNRLHNIFDAQVVSPPRQPIPLDVLYLPSVNDQIGIKLAADRFCDSFFRLKSAGKGDRQKEALAAAAERAFTRTQPTRLSDIRDSLQAEYQRRGLKHDGAMSLLNSLSRYPIFEPLQSPADFFRQSWIVKLAASEGTDDTRTIVVNLLLDALERHLLSLPNAPLDSTGSTALRHILFIDEAHLILGKKLPALSALIRQSRSKGGIVVLGSQSPDDFEGEDDDFLAQMGMVATFATNARPAAVKRIMGGVNLDLPGLPDGTCWLRRLGDQSPCRVKAFEP